VKVHLFAKMRLLVSYCSLSQCLQADIVLCERVLSGLLPKGSSKHEPRLYAVRPVGPRAHVEARRHKRRIVALLRLLHCFGTLEDFMRELSIAYAIVVWHVA
jgi:hypothetical protein